MLEISGLKNKNEERRMSMFGKLLLGCALVVTIGVTTAPAVDVKRKLPIQSALNLEPVKRKIAGDVAFFWGDQPHPPAEKTFGTFKSSQRTKMDSGKDADTACALAMAQALVSLRDHAEVEGANAVVNIVSNLKDERESSTTEYSCMVGAMMVNVALKGTVVTFKKK
jgi:uncharacterized protein YbjQ (UPF0145 family)